MRPSLPTRARRAKPRAGRPPCAAVLAGIAGSAAAQPEAGGDEALLGTLADPVAAPIRVPSGTPTTTGSERHEPAAATP